MLSKVYVVKLRIVGICQHGAGNQLLDSFDAPTEIVASGDTFSAVQIGGELILRLLWLFTGGSRSSCCVSFGHSLRSNGRIVFEEMLSYKLVFDYLGEG